MSNEQQSVQIGMMDWDDSALIKAYDDAINTYIDEHNPNKNIPNQKTKQKKTKKRKRDPQNNETPPSKVPAIQQINSVSPIPIPEQISNQNNANMYQQYYSQYYPPPIQSHYPSYYPSPQQQIPVSPHTYPYYPQNIQQNLSIPFTPISGNEELGKILMAWYNAGYSTGRYQALEEMKKRTL